MELGANQLMLVRDRRDEGQPTAWQVVVYRVDNNTLVRMASRPALSRNAVQGAMVNLRQGAPGGAQVRPLLADTAELAARVRVEPAGWQAENGRVRAALMQQSCYRQRGGTGRNRRRHRRRQRRETPAPPISTATPRCARWS